MLRVDSEMGSLRESTANLKVVEKQNLSVW